MKTSHLLLPALLLTLLMSSCFYEVAEPAHVEISHSEEYETEDVHRHGNYTEYTYTAWVEVNVRNTGGITAHNVDLEIVLFDGNREYSTIVAVPDLYPGERHTITFDTGYSFLNDYDGYEVFVYWD